VRLIQLFICSMPHKYWGMSSLTYIIEHIDFINLGAGSQIFADPPLGWPNQGGGAVAHPSTSPRTP
jgi:hypothetical protein